jgi:hypothetical protein
VLTERPKVAKTPIFFLFDPSRGVPFALQATSDTLMIKCKYFGVIGDFVAKYRHYG